MRKLFLPLPGLLLVSGLFAQEVFNCWAPLSAKDAASLANAKVASMPSEYQLYSLDRAQLLSALAKASMEYAEAVRTAPLHLVLPTPSGDFQGFEVFESALMAPELAAKFPGIKSYAGQSLDGSGTLVRMGVGPQGFHAFVFEADGRANIIEPMDKEGQDSPYMVYEQGKLPDFHLRCGVDQGHVEAVDMGKPSVLDGGAQNRGSAALVTVKKYRMAISAKAEYSNFISASGNKAVILAAMVKALDYIVALTERDLNVRFELVPNNDRLIFTDPATDPFSGNLVSQWMQQNISAINDSIGVNNYDIGHIFGKFVTGTAVGVAIPGSTCTAGKAQGASSETEPDNQRFYLVAAHEMCHQLNGRHTWSNCTTDSQSQLNAPTAFEPGSGSTIMGYPGACGNNDVQGGNDPYYHASSIAETQLFITQGTGKNCGSIIQTTNNAPEVSIPLGEGLVIPRSTPFELTALASDADGHSLTYCWEQMDLGPTTTYGSPSGTSPSFRSFPPVSNPTRSFPRIGNVLNASANKAEVLPSYSREFKFRVTVRDNQIGGGGVNHANVKFNATADAGPFRVRSQNTTSIVWRPGETQEILWDVANTDKAPVNCQKVNILLSPNGGNTGQFPIVLASGVPNNGRACIAVPDTIVATARIKVEAADNIFYNVARFNVRIDTIKEGFSLCSAPPSTLVCIPQSYETTISTAAHEGFSGPIAFSANGLPAGVTVRFEPNPVAAGGSTKMLLSYGSDVKEGLDTFTVRATSGGLFRESTFFVNLVFNDFSALALNTPANGSTNAGQSPTLTWTTSPNALAYEVQVAESPTFEASTISVGRNNLTTGSLQIAPPLQKGQRYFWRVRPINECSPSDWTDPFVFLTSLETCTTLVANDLPKQITLGLNTVESKVVFNDNGTLSDVNIVQIKGNHTAFNDLTARLIAPDGTATALFANRCGAVNSNFDLAFDQSTAVTTFPCPPPNNATAIRPSGNLDALNGKSATGTWTLRVADNTNGGGGNLTGFGLQLCFAKQIESPILLTNLPLRLNASATGAIGSGLLQAQDNQSGPAQLTFTLMTVPKSGQLRRNGTILKVGDQFTQADIDQNLLSYLETGGQSGDYFKFIVVDADGGFVTGTFTIEVSVDAFEPQQGIAFRLSPNPATDQLRLDFPEALPLDTRAVLTNAAGQQVRTWALAYGQMNAFLDLGTLPNGIYALSLANGKGKAAKKVAVQR